MRMKTVISFLISAIILTVGLALAETTPPSAKPKSVKERCKILKKELKELEKQKAAVIVEVAKFEKQFQESRARFENYRSRLATMSGCSQGNPGNSSECQQVLAGLKLSGNDMNQADAQRKEPARRKNQIENSMLTPLANQKLLECPK